MQISLNEVKVYLKIEDNEEDTLLDILIKAAISFCETKLNRPILDSNMTTENTWVVAEEIRIAIYMLITHWYENRSLIGQITNEIDFSVSAILKPHRFINV